MGTIKVDEGESWKAALRKARNNRLSRNHLLTGGIIGGILVGSCSMWAIMSYWGGG